MKKVLLINLLIFLILFELIGRVFLKPYWKSTQYNYPQFLFVEDDSLGFKLNKNFKGKHSFEDYSYDVFTNSIGCFDIEPKKKSFDNIFLGDSHTFGYVPFGSRFSDLYKNKINKSTINCSCTGANPLHQKEILKRLYSKGYSFKKIYYGYLLTNDFEDDFYFPRYSVINGFRVFAKTKEPSPYTFLLINLRQNLFSVDFLLKSYKYIKSLLINKEELINGSSQRLLFSVDNFEKDVRFNNHLNNILDLKKLINKNNGELILLPIPINYKYMKNNEKITIQNANNYLDKFLNKNKIKFLRTKSDPLNFWKYNGHLNLYGHLKMYNTLEKEHIKNK